MDVEIFKDLFISSVSVIPPFLFLILGVFILSLFFFYSGSKGVDYFVGLFKDPAFECVYLSCYLFLIQYLFVEHMNGSYQHIGGLKTIGEKMC